MSRAIALLSNYGVFELKRAYRKNLAVGIFIACLLNLAAIGGVMIVNGLKAEVPKPRGIIVLQSATELGQPPYILPEDVPVRIAVPERAMPSVGVPVPVPDEEAPTEVNFVSQDDLRDLIQAQPVIDLEDIGDQEIVLNNVEELLPEPTDFVAYEEMPEIIVKVDPIYPELARRAGLTGEVWVNALIDKDGKVRDVQIVKNSGSDAGFEEAAIEAALKTSWKPAISNGQPIAVWTTYKITFVIRGR